MHTYIHTCIHACMHAYIHTYRQTDIHTYTSIRLAISIITYTSAWFYLLIYGYMKCKLLTIIVCLQYAFMHLGWLKQLSSQEDQEDLISAMWHTKLSPVLPQFLGAAECFLSTAVDALHCLPCSGDEPCKYRSKVSRLETNVKSLRFTMIYPTKSDKLHATLPNFCNSRWRPQAGQPSMTSMKTFYFWKEKKLDGNICNQQMWPALPHLMPWWRELLSQLHLRPGEAAGHSSRRTCHKTRVQNLKGHCKVSQSQMSSQSGTLISFEGMAGKDPRLGHWKVAN